MKNKNYSLYFLAFAFLFYCFSINTYAQSDVCASAVPITPTITCGTGFGYSIPASFGNDNTAANLSCINDAAITRDAWFSFVANSTTTEIRATTPGDRNIGLGVYEGVEQIK